MNAAGLALILAALLAAPAVSAATLRGRVVDPAGKPVEFANVRVVALQKGAVTDAQGEFTLELPDGPVVLEVSQIGYRPARVSLEARAGLAPLSVALAEEPVPVTEVSVEASSFGKAGKSEGAVVRRMDVYTTPGGAADVFQSLRALPGINAPAEGAALYVRGGDPSETVIRVDGAEIGHPYHYEGASGGLFGILDAYMLKSAFFSSGGFASRYGGAMSGVLDIETQDPMNLRTASVGANIVGGSFASTWALVPDKLSALVSVNQSMTSLLFKLYGSNRDYEQAPTSFNGVGKLLWRYSGSGRLSVFDIVSTERIGVFATPLNVREPYDSHARNDFVALNLKDAIAGRVAVRANLTTQRYGSDYSFSAFRARRIERTSQGLVDFTWPMGHRNELAFGGAWRHRGVDRSGLAAADSTELGAGAAAREFRQDRTLVEPGAYVEDKVRVVGPLYATFGTRVDRADNVGRWLVDPRAALAWRLDEHQTVRVAGGRYHQLASLDKLTPVFGNPSLGPSWADHVITGYEWKSDFGNVRLEGYQKRYHGLAVVDSATWYRAAGTGYARGIDAFVQGTWKQWNGWVSYGFQDSKRRENDDTREVPSPYGVRHDVTVVAQYAYNMRWQFGGRWSHTTGRPWTPIVGATYDAAHATWQPVYGEHGSATMPAYDRADLRLTRLFSLPKTVVPATSICVFYAECMNVLGKPNVLDYSYSPDYSVRTANRSYFGRRLVVAGFSLSW